MACTPVNYKKALCCVTGLKHSEFRIFILCVCLCVCVCVWGGGGGCVHAHLRELIVSLLECLSSLAREKNTNNRIEQFSLV